MSGARPGRVILVGAGPGDPDLLTLRGAAALRSADAVVFDALAAPELLDLAPEGALRIDVGKRGHDSPTRPQEEITRLLLELVKEGRTVVRLKGGDPFVFGRGGEECSALAEAGIPFEVVPGVSSVEGALACAGIPLTDRRYSASFAVATGHKDPTRVSAETHWEGLATAADTLVVVMGMRNLAALVERMLAGGRAADTPAAVVMEGSLPRQRVVVAPLAEIADAARAAGLGAPAVVVVGEVVRLRESLRWLERRPLFGRRVLVTRPAEQAGGLVAALRAAGAEPVCVPLLRIAPPEDWGPVDAALDELARYDALLFASRNGVAGLARRATDTGRSLAGFSGPCFCVGPATAEAAREQGLGVGTLPGGGSDARALLERIVAHHAPAGRRYLLARAAGGGEVLPEGLSRAGARVDAVAVYRTLPAEVDGGALRDGLAAGELDALTFASPSAVRCFAALLDPAAREAAGRCVVAAIGRVTAEALRVEGLPADAVAERAAPEEIVAALIRATPAPAGGAR